MLNACITGYWVPPWPQDDVLFHNLTVRETFEFAAAMCLPGSVPAAAKRQLAARVISELGLAKVENTYVGVSHGIEECFCCAGLTDSATDNTIT